MEKSVLATRQILSGEREVDNVSYSKEGGKLNVWFSHAANTESGDLVSTSWEHVETLFPPISELDFGQDSEILRFDVHESRWKPV